MVDDFIGAFDVPINQFQINPDAIEQMKQVLIGYGLLDASHDYFEGAGALREMMHIAECLSGNTTH
ncbi:MAG TPA: hypothetical protein VM577_19480, partial [Anaerovoracaceae bacterium]|nr:hypothetical protein [Anaerovoracaceae bacterium]